MIAFELADELEFLRRLTEQASQSSSVVPVDLKSQWSDLERRLLRDLRAEERQASAAGSPLRELQAICANELIRNLTWEISISFELQSPRTAALRKLAELLRARARSAAQVSSAA